MGLFPTLVLASLLLTFFLSGAPPQPPDLMNALQRAGKVHAEGLAFLGFVTLIAGFILQPLQFGLLRTFEGYWSTFGVVGIVTELFTALQRWRLRRLIDKSSVDDDRTPTPREEMRANRAEALLRSQFPRYDRLLPTRIGNIIRAAEDRTGERYSLDAVAMWPRLYLVLPKQVLDVLSDQRNQLDLSLRLCVVFVVATVAYTAALAPHMADLAHAWTWLLFPATAAVLAWLSYRAARSAAAAYGIAIEIAFDLHRFDLLAALHLQLPRDYKTELATNRILRDVFRHSPTSHLIDVPILRYRHRAQGQSGGRVGERAAARSRGRRESRSSPPST